MPAQYLPLPDDAARIELGVARDRFDLGKGFAPLEIPEEGGKTAKRGVMNDSPMGAGLRDGAALAFRWTAASTEEDHVDEKGEGVEAQTAEWDVLVPGLDEEDEEMEGA